MEMGGVSTVKIGADGKESALLVRRGAGRWIGLVAVVLVLGVGGAWYTHERRMKGKAEMSRLTRLLHDTGSRVEGLRRVSDRLDDSKESSETKEKLAKELKIGNEVHKAQVEHARAQANVMKRGNVPNALHAAAADKAAQTVPADMQRAMLGQFLAKGQFLMWATTKEREQAWREFAGSGAEDNDTGESGRGRDRSISGASAVGGGARRAIRARGGIRAGARRGSLSDGGDSDGEGDGGGGGKHTAQRASARHGSEVWSDDDAEEGVWEGGKLRSTTWHGPERRAFEARRKQLLARYEADAILLDTGVGGGAISGADDSSRGRFSNTEESGRGRDKSISGADDGGRGGLAGPESLTRLLAPPPQRASRARRPSVTRHPELAAALSTREDSIAAQIPAWQHVDKRLPLLASASAIKLAPLRVKSAAARTKKTEPAPPSVGRSTWGRSHRDELPRSWKTKFQK